MSLEGRKGGFKMGQRPAGSVRSSSVMKSAKQTIKPMNMKKVHVKAQHVSNASF